MRATRWRAMTILKAGRTAWIASFLKTKMPDAPLSGAIVHAFPNARFNSPLARSSRARWVLGRPLPARLI